MKQKIVVTLWLIICQGISVKAQQNMISNSSGYLNSFTLEKGRQPDKERYQNIDNSPYLDTEWRNGMLKLRGGKVFENQELKFNTYENKIEYLLDQKTFELTVAVEEFGWDKKAENYGVLFRVESKLIENGNAQVFYQVLSDGKIKLLKQVKTTIKTVPDPIALGLEKKEFSNSESYFILNKGIITKVKKDKKSIVEAINQTNLQELINKKDTKFNNWESIKELIDEVGK